MLSVYCQTLIHALLKSSQFGFCHNNINRGLLSTFVTITTLNVSSAPSYHHYHHYHHYHQQSPDASPKVLRGPDMMLGVRDSIL